MALNSSKHLRNQVIYSVYVRNHSEKGTFSEVTKDLERIKALGTDILWLMPIHPIGQTNKKGELGCPYSISDYTQVNPEYGTEEDFTQLIHKTHQLGMKIMIDVVYNHTAHDATYRTTHPEYYYKKPNGQFGNKVADWTDIIDLDYANISLWEEQIEALEKWTRLGVDGYRCDVAPLVPIEFWLEARKRVAKINPECVWLSETIHPHFVEYVRNQGFYAASDSEIYQAFDITYDYDTHAELIKYLEGHISLDYFLEKKRMQEYIYPENYSKLRYLENHDNPRAKYLIPNEILLKNWTAFMFFEKGPALLYAGQEFQDIKQPSLFDRDLIQFDLTKQYFADYIAQLAKIKKDPILATGIYRIHKTNQDGIIYMSYYKEQTLFIGIINVSGKVGCFDLTFENQDYGPVFYFDELHVQNILDLSTITDRKSVV